MTLLSLPDTPCLTHADASQLETAIVNLAVNARDAMAGRGALRIVVGRAARIPAVRGHVARDGDFVTIGVHDTGSGIDPAHIEHIFEPFFTSKAIGHGTGLGLSQVFGFVKQSGGHVSISSTPGKGTCVKVFMPRFHGALSQEDPTVASEILPAGRSEVILLVEDDVQVRHLSEAMLRELGYVVLATANALVV